MARANNSGGNEVEVLIGNVWETINYAMFEGKQKTNGDKTQANICKTIGQVAKKKTVWGVWKQIKILNKSISTIFKLMKATS